MDDEATGQGWIRRRQIGRISTKEFHTGGGRRQQQLLSSPPASAAVAELSDSELLIPFGFGDQGAVVDLVGYTDQEGGRAIDGPYRRRRMRLLQAQK